MKRRTRERHERAALEILHDRAQIHRVRDHLQTSTAHIHSTKPRSRWNSVPGSTPGRAACQPAPQRSLPHPAPACIPTKSAQEQREKEEKRLTDEDPVDLLDPIKQRVR